MNHPEMISLLLELGADPDGTDDSGNTASVYATTPKADRPLLEWKLKAGAPKDLFTAVALNDWESASDCPTVALSSPDSTSLTAGVLHLMAKRKDLDAVRWLLSRGADPDATWDHFGAMVTPLHMAVWQGNADIVRALLDAGADPKIHDSMHDSDAIGWAEYSGRSELVDILKNHTRDL